MWRLSQCFFEKLSPFCENILSKFSFLEKENIYLKNSPNFAEVV
jgi:hypothetical protein